MTYITQSGAVVTVDIGGITFPGDAKDMNNKAFTIGGANKPLLQFAIQLKSASATVPIGYAGEPIVVYVNGYKLETGSVGAPVVSSIEITAPEAGATLTAAGTATAKVLDQYGGEMSGEAVSWTSSNASKLTIVSGTGAYTLVGDGEVNITATSNTVGTVTKTVSVTVDVA